MELLTRGRIKSVYAPQSGNGLGLFFLLKFKYYSHTILYEVPYVWIM